MTIVFMFSGQGSQYFNMGKALFDRNSVFRSWMRSLDNLVHDLIGESLIERIYDEKKQFGDQFLRTLHTYPAIFMVEYSLAQVLLESGIEPDHVLGTSMGEFASAALAGVMKVEEALEVLIKQAECVETYCERGGMCAIIHAPALYSETPLIHENSELVSVNYDSHFVVSGRKERLEKIVKFLKSKNIVAQPLPVNYGYHSSCIDPAGMPFKDYARRKSYRSPNISFISGLYGTSVRDISSEYFWDVVRKPICFSKAIRELENHEERIYLDIGPGGTLANFAKRNCSANSTSECYAIMTMFNQEIINIAKVRQRICNRKPVTTGKDQ
jgi:acyl transferase domain-containing protein